MLVLLSHFFSLQGIVMHRESTKQSECRPIWQTLLYEIHIWKMNKNQWFLMKVSCLCLFLALCTVRGPGWLTLTCEAENKQQHPHFLFSVKGCCWKPVFAQSLWERQHQTFWAERDETKDVRVLPQRLGRFLHLHGGGSFTRWVGKSADLWRHYCLWNAVGKVLLHVALFCRDI